MLHAIYLDSKQQRSKNLGELTFEMGNGLKINSKNGTRESKKY